jgi:hypothetical protein
MSLSLESLHTIILFNLFFFKKNDIFKVFLMK